MSSSAIAPQVDREQWLIERKKGVGGSDQASVQNVGYGCRLRLWRDKRDEVPDYPPEENDAMQLGQVLEPFFAKKYERVTRRNVVTRHHPVIHPDYPELRVNIDREILSDENGQDEGESGVLEIKSVGRGPFYKIKREGLPEDYILQLQHAILCVGTTWGAFAVGCRDTGELIYWDVERDEALAPIIIEESRQFWQDVLTGNMPDRLEPDDRRCQRCEYRKSCQGNALIQVEYQGEVQRDETLAPLVRELQERKKLLKEAEELVDETGEQLKTELGDRQAVEAGGSTIYYRPQVSMRGDFKTLATEYEALRELMLTASKDKPEVHKLLQIQYPPSQDFKKPSPSRPLRIY